MIYDLLKPMEDKISFYDRIENITDCIEEKINTTLTTEMVNYQHYIQERKIEPVRSVLEYAVEFLLLGVTYRWVMQKMLEVSDESLQVIEYLPKILNTLEASGEYKEEVIRFNPIYQYMTCQTVSGFNKLWYKIEKIVEDIKQLGDQNLRQYLFEMDSYLMENRKNKSLRGDAYFILRDESSYYMNIIGAVILNRVYREAYVHTKQKYIFVPGCMVAAKEHCQALEVEDGYKCLHCTKGCLVSEVTKQHSSLEMRVRILYHESEMNNKKVSQRDRVGVVGVACILNLLSGGFKARRLGYLPQCVFLTSCGCKKHWSNQGEVTKISSEQLKRVVEFQ